MTRFYLTHKAIFTVIFPVLVLAACAQKPKTPSISTAVDMNRVVNDSKPIEADQRYPDAEYLIALDLASTLVRVKGAGPDQIELRLSNSSDPFNHYLAQVFDSVGYTLVSSSQALEGTPVNYSFDGPRSRAAETIENEVSTYQLEVGVIKLKRDYRFAEGLVTPLSPASVYGADSTDSKSNNALFNPATQRALLNAKREELGSSILVANSGLDPFSESDESSGDSSSINGHLGISAVTQSGEYSGQSQQPQLALRTDRDNVYEEGQPIVVSMEVSQDSYVFCFYQDGLGNVTKIFPNRFSSENFVKAGDKRHIPNTAKWQMTATLAQEREKIMCIAAGSEMSSKMAGLPEVPDLQPLWLNDMQQVYELYTAAVGDDLSNQHLSIEVN